MNYDADEMSDNTDDFSYDAEESNHDEEDMSYDAEEMSHDTEDIFHDARDTSVNSVEKKYYAEAGAEAGAEDTSNDLEDMTDSFISNDEKTKELIYIPPESMNLETDPSVPPSNDDIETEFQLPTDMEHGTNMAGKQRKVEYSAGEKIETSFSNPSVSSTGTEGMVSETDNLVSTDKKCVTEGMNSETDPLVFTFNDNKNSHPCKGDFETDHQLPTAMEHGTNMAGKQRKVEYSTGEKIETSFSNPSVSSTGTEGMVSETDNLVSTDKKCVTEGMNSETDPLVFTFNDNKNSHPCKGDFETDHQLPTDMEYGTKIVGKQRKVEYSTGENLLTPSNGTEAKVSETDNLVSTDKKYVTEGMNSETNPLVSKYNDNKNSHPHESDFETDYRLPTDMEYGTKMAGKQWNVKYSTGEKIKRSFSNLSTPSTSTEGMVSETDPLVSTNKKCVTEGMNSETNPLVSKYNDNKNSHPHEGDFETDYRLPTDMEYGTNMAGKQWNVKYSTGEKIKELFYYSTEGMKSETDPLVSTGKKTKESLYNPLTYGTEDRNSETDPLVPTGKKKTLSCYKPQTSFSDHFSLETPSDEIRFSTCAVRVFRSGTSQFQIIEEKDDTKNDDDDGHRPSKTLQAKVTSDGSSSLSFLRACYTLITVLMMGFLLIFSIQVLFFLFVNLISEGGLTSKQSLNKLSLAGTLLSIPVMVYGLSSALAMATEFVLDTWNGHEFFRSVLRISAVVIDWFYLVMFLLLPLGVMLFLMFTNEHWWVGTALTWFGSITVTYCIFCLVVFVVEIQGALELLAHHPDYKLLDLNWRNVGNFLGRAVLLRQNHSYSGKWLRTFFIEGTKDFPSANVSYGNSDLVDDEFTYETISIYSRLTKMMPNCLFTVYESPKRISNVEDVLDRITYVTDSSWNLEKAFCRRKESRQVLVVNGPSQILPSQLASSLICKILGNLLMIVVLAAILKWGGLSTTTVFTLTVLFAWSRIREFYEVYKLYDTYQDTLKRRKKRGSVTGGFDKMSDSEAIYQVSEKHCITKPSDKLCWFLFGCESLGLFVFPLFMLYRVGNTAIAILFAILGVFSACRHYVSAPAVLGELGSLDLLDGNFFKSPRSLDTERTWDATRSLNRGNRWHRSAVEAEDDWRDKNRLSKIVGRISQGDRLDTWMKVIASFVLIFLFLFFSAFAGGSDDGKATTGSSFLLHDFRYIPKEDSFRYPTCDMTAAFKIPGGGTESHAMMDYAYLSWIAYSAPESMPDLLDGWFGQGVAYDDVDTVNEFHELQGSHSAVHYKLIRFPANPKFALVTIRGTSNGWDMISDAQLWSASLLAQVLRAALPFGNIWNPILEELVSLTAAVQSSSLKEVAFYVQTTNFVNYLKLKNIFSALRITGHSLGGGLAMITGAQTQTPAIGLSGPNTMITRKTLIPPVSVDDLNTYTFNIIPDRDVVPMIDDPAKNTQKISCSAATNNFISCHTAVRSLCDIQYTCGSGVDYSRRPVLCQCALNFGYPEPEPTGNRTFAEACGRL